MADNTVTNLECTCRSPTCAINHLDNARANPALDEDASTQEKLTFAREALIQARAEVRLTLRYEAAAQNDD